MLGSQSLSGKKATLAWPSPLLATRLQTSGLSSPLDNLQTVCYTLTSGGAMTKDDVQKIVHGMPDGMNVNDYLTELVNRALYLERQRLRGIIEDEIKGWDIKYQDAVYDAIQVLDN